MKDKTIACITGVICITILEAIALAKGIDGQIFATTLATITGLVGYMFGKR